MIKTLTMALYLGPGIFVEDFLAARPLHRSIMGSQSFLRKERAFKVDPERSTTSNRGKSRRLEGCTLERRSAPRSHGAMPGLTAFSFPSVKPNPRRPPSQTQRALASLFSLHSNIVSASFDAVSNAGTEIKENFFTSHHHNNNPKTEILALVGCVKAASCGRSRAHRSLLAAGDRSLFFSLAWLLLLDPKNASHH